MDFHSQKDLLSAYLDRELSSDDSSRVLAHLQSCKDCEKELKEMRALKSISKSLPKRALPPAVLAWLEEKAVEKLARKWWRAFAGLPRIWVPAAGLAALLILGVLFMQKPFQERIPVETILAAHHRYLDEGTMPPADLVSGSFSGKLATVEESVE